jgi:hypothetical protein
MTPPKLGAKEFEELLLKAATRCPAIHMVRYGTQSSFDRTGKPIALQSLPDFEGAIAPNGNQFIVEAKVCGTASFPLVKDKLKPRQVKHMLDRAKVGVPCFLMIHWTEMKRATGATLSPAETRAIRINPLDPRWQAFLDAHAEAKRTGQPVAPQGSISREISVRIGTRVEWTCPKGCRTHLPDLAALLGIEPVQPSLL